MKLLGLFFAGLVGVMALGCGEDDVPLQVDFQYETNCIPEGGCPTDDHALVGRNGAEIPELANSSLGIECSIVNAGDTTIVTSLKVQDKNVNVTLPDNGIHIRNGRLAVGSSMTCADDDVQIYQGNEFSGGCTGLTEGNCAILVNEYSAKKGRMVLEIDCDHLAGPAAGAVRSLADGLLTIQGCDVTEDTR